MFKIIWKKFEIKTLSLGELESKCKDIKFFRWVFMRDMLSDKINNKECGIINLRSSFLSGTHWTCYYKIDNILYYFHSFGDVNPPVELIK